MQEPRVKPAIISLLKECTNKMIHKDICYSRRSVPHEGLFSKASSSQQMGTNTETNKWAGWVGWGFGTLGPPCDVFAEVLLSRLMCLCREEAGSLWELGRWMASRGQCPPDTTGPVHKLRDWGGTHKICTDSGQTRFQDWEGNLDMRSHP